MRISLVIFKSFPLDLAALNASKLSYCKNDGKTEVLGLLYKKQNEWIKGEKLEDYNKNLKEILEANNIKLNFEECLNSKDLEDFILNQRITGSKKYKSGNLSDIACTSFYPTKNLGCFGDGGAIFTNSKSIAKKCFLLIIFLFYIFDNGYFKLQLI